MKRCLTLKNKEFPQPQLQLLLLQRTDLAANPYSLLHATMRLGIYFYEANLPVCLQCIVAPQRATDSEKGKHAGKRYLHAQSGGLRRSGGGEKEREEHSSVCVSSGITSSLLQEN